MVVTSTIIWYVACTALAIIVSSMGFDFDRNVSGHADKKIAHYVEPSGFYYPDKTYVKKGNVPYQNHKLLIVNTHGTPAITGRDESGFERTMSAIHADIVNVSNQTLYDIEIGVKVYDNGKMIDPDEDGLEEFTFLWKSSLATRESSIAKYTPEITGWDCYEIFVKSYATKDEIIYDGDFFYQKGLEITKFKDERGKYTVEVRNTSDRPMHNVLLVVIKRDGENHIIGEKVISINGMGSGGTRKESFTGYLEGLRFERTLDIWQYKKPDKVNVFAVGWQFNTRFPGNPYLSSYEEKRFDIVPSVLSEFRSNFYHSGSLMMSHLNEEDYHSNASQLVASCNPARENVSNSSWHIGKSSMGERENRNLDTIIPGRFKIATYQWIHNGIADDDFAGEIRHLVENDIIKLDKQRNEDGEFDNDTSYVLEQKSHVNNCFEPQCQKAKSQSKSEYPGIPYWIKEVSIWWMDEKISTRTYIEMLEFLVNHYQISI